MSKTILQVRDIPESVVAKLRDRAAEQGISLSAYIRQLLTLEAGTRDDLRSDRADRRSGTR